MVAITGSAKRRIASLLDPNSFIEIGGSVIARSTDFNMQAEKAASDGVLTGYGTIDGNLVYVYGQEPEVLGGSIGEMHAKKIANIYKMAGKMGAPVIGLIDCSGVRVQESTDALAALGAIYKDMAIVSGTIPQYIAVFGNCGGGISFIPALADFTFMETEKARVFVNSPDAIKGNNRDKFDNTTVEYQTSVGNIDFAGTEEEIIAAMRSLISILPANCDDEGAIGVCQDDLNRACVGIEGYTDDTYGLLYEISDDHFVIESGKNYGKSVITAFIRMNGQTVGAVANRACLTGEDGEREDLFGGKLTSKAVRKAAKFVSFCDAYNIPVLTVANTDGFAQMECTEDTLPKAAARLLYAYANATVPKVTLNIGKTYGSAGVIMGSKSVGADMVYAWNNAEIGTMDASAAAKIICAGDSAADIRSTATQYSNLCQSADAAAGRGYVDTVILPADTRKYLVGAFEMLYSKREDIQDKKHGTV
ncbi:MAG: carboxyl transferase domain-containing protein [Lachnospiraceae bacterium]|jgi:acetyl-CoA carboxylase carboxyltransferase component